MPKAFLVRKDRHHIAIPGLLRDSTSAQLPYPSVRPVTSVTTSVTAGGCIPDGRLVSYCSAMTPGLNSDSDMQSLHADTRGLHASYMNMVMQYRLGMRDYPEMYRDAPAPIDLSTSDLSTSDLPPTPCYTPESDYSSSGKLYTL